MASNVGEFFKNFWSSFTEKLSNLAKTIGEFFTTLGENIGQFFKDLLTGLGNFIKGFFNGFATVFDFLIHIIIPNEEQINTIKEDYKDLGDVLLNKIPFVRII